MDIGNIKILAKKLNKNIFFVIVGTWNTSEFLSERIFNEQVSFDNNFLNFDFLRQFPKTRINNDDVYYLPKSYSSIQSTF